jgi:hypothetical protein
MFGNTLRVQLTIVASVAFSTTLLSADTIALCTPTFSDCAIPENVLLDFPFLAISGDVLLVPNLNAKLAAVSDVFRVFNNFVDTGLGTGIGFVSFLYSGHNTLPSTSTYSANAVEIREQPTGPTQYLGNGTDYHLLTSVNPEHGAGRSAAPGKNALIDIDGRPVAVATGFHSAVGQGPDQDPGQVDGLAFYKANYTALGGKQPPFNIVGTNPALGAATTTVPTVIVPVKVVFQTPGVTLDGTNVLSAVQNSPIFQNSGYTAGTVDLGITQYGDALQRVESYNIPGFSVNYHVLLGTPAVAPALTVTITLPSQGNVYRLRNGNLVGVVAFGVLDSAIGSQIRKYATNTLPIYLTDNVYESFDGTIGTCCIFGYHASQGPPATTAKTWIYPTYTEPGTFVGDIFSDVVPLSHEVAEWLNDPFVGALAVRFLNIIPPAILPGQGGACIINFEVGDPLEALPTGPAEFTQVTNGTTYHLQDVVFLPWYLHTIPSFSVNGWYTFRNALPASSSLCGAG